ncbi:MAG: nucleoside triphosphate pyrophosphohydrolase [Bacteroidota bacterium]|nr:nucleoside triphosphate pyrophosphohydrolase [Bacteroidota bacterium]
MKEKLKAFQRLLEIMDTLREECPWDKKQTLETLRHLTIEETYELSDAILSNNREEIRKELGDLMLHIVFYSKIASEQQAFDITGVLNGISDKLIHRHPHIYSDTKVNNAEEVANNWEKLKLKEGRKSVLEGVPNSMPSLVKALRIQEKVKGVGFEWDEKEEAWAKVLEEQNELKQEVENNSPKKVLENEMGDVLFSMINYARYIDVNPEDALERTNKKFISRFQYIEKEAAKAGRQVQDMTLGEMDVLWNKAKEKENL